MNIQVDKISGGIMDYSKFYRNDLEKYLFDDVINKFEENGYINAFDFFCIIIWKANRAKTKVANKICKIEKSNYRPWEDVPADKIDEYPKTLEAFTDPLLQDSKIEDVIWEVAIKEGFSLSSSIEAKDVGGHTSYQVIDAEKEQEFLICLDERLDNDFVKALAPGKEYLFICRDIALTDELAANLALQCRLKTI